MASKLKAGFVMDRASVMLLPNTQPRNICRRRASHSRSLKHYDYISISCAHANLRYRTLSQNSIALSDRGYDCSAAFAKITRNNHTRHWTTLIGSTPIHSNVRSHNDTGQSVNLCDY